VTTNASTVLYQRLIRADREGQSPQQQTAVARNGLLQLLASVLQTCGDQVVNAKTVLPWLFAVVGAPSGLIGLLVPIRESGSMLPQAAMSPWVQRQPRSASVWLLGAAGQALATATIALLAATARGWLAGMGLLLALAVFALARSLSSLASKDVLGRTVPKGERGQINGVSTALAGAVAILLGLALRVYGGASTSATVLAALLFGAAGCWLLALLVYSRVREPAPHGDPAADEQSWWQQARQVLREDRAFQRFVVARTLLLVSALSPPFVVALAANQSHATLSGLGPFVLAQGVANLVGGRLFGRLADRSSRRLMIGTAAAASGLVAAFLLAYSVHSPAWWLYPLTYLGLALVHTGVRVARKTYVVDLADGPQRTRYVAVSNTLMGLLLLVIGAISGGLALLGEPVALGFLAVLGAAGAMASHTLPEASHG
jgi:predicted MFS family arabinose efflux permease